MMMVQNKVYLQNIGEYFQFQNMNALFAKCFVTAMIEIKQS